MFCTQCGNEIKEGMRFCTACGAPAANTPAPAPVKEPAPAIPPAPQPMPYGAMPGYPYPPQPAPAPKKKHTGLIVALIVAFVLVIGAAGVGAYLFWTSPAQVYKRTMIAADHYMETGDYDKALEGYTACKEMNVPQNEASFMLAELYEKKGDSYYNSRQYVEAIDEYTKSMRENPAKDLSSKIYDCYKQLADNEFIMGNYEKASGYYLNLITLDRTKADGYIGTADVILSKDSDNNAIEAIDYLKGAIELGGDAAALNARIDYIRENSVMTEMTTTYASGVITTSKYDEAGHVLSTESSEGMWYRYEYNEAGLQTYCINDQGYWFECEYDSMGNTTYFANSDGYSYRYGYDAHGNVCFFESSDGTWSTYKYDENDHLLYYENSSGYWTSYTYDANGNQLTSTSSDGYWYRQDIDENGNYTYYEDSYGNTSKYTYDDFGKLAYAYYEEDDWVIYEYCYRFIGKIR